MDECRGIETGEKVVPLRGEDVCGEVLEEKEERSEAMSDREAYRALYGDLVDVVPFYNL